MREGTGECPGRIRVGTKTEKGAPSRSCFGLSKKTRGAEEGQSFNFGGERVEHRAQRVSFYRRCPLQLEKYRDRKNKVKTKWWVIVEGVDREGGEESEGRGFGE